jgi:hypothetical protein
VTVETPCKADPDAWFIGKDGKQYRDDDVLTMSEASEAVKHLDPADLGFGEAWEDALAGALEAAAEEKTRQALIRRRKARDACYECPVRLPCLDVRLETKIEHGTWGGYYEEQLRVLERERETQRLRHP